MPACYSTCDLYAPRRDGKCRRFVKGIEVVPMPQHPQGYVAKVTFKQWGQLMAYANTRLVPIDEAAAIERRVRRVESVAAAWPGSSVSIAGRRGIPSRLAGRWKHRVSSGGGEPLGGAPDCLLIEVFHPEPRPAALTLSVSNPGQAPFEARLDLRPGFQAIEVPVGPMLERVDLDDEILLALDPNITEPADEGLTLYFGLVAFVRRREDPRPVRVAVWDLDQTLWSGTLLEHGLEGISLREDAVAVVRALDERGVVNSVLSKNHPQDGLAALEHFGIDGLFAFPTIAWGDKGTLMTGLVRRFGMDVRDVALIDDQAFERAQTVAANPGLRTYDSRDVLRLLDLPEFDPARSNESSNRRQHYVAEAQRTAAHEAAGGDYLTFLATCDLRIDIRHPDEAALDRIHELVQRTNRLNYSGVHHSRAAATAMIGDVANECFVVSCVDTFGDYGTIGFLVVDRGQECLSEATFSCRVHFKRIEHAAISFLLDRSRERGATHFDARFRATERNADAVSVFADLGFREVDRHGGERRYRFDLTQPIPDEHIVAITYEGVPWEPRGTNSDV
jgi:FkbH-like protein